MKALDEFGFSARALEGDMAYGILCDNPDAADGTDCSMRITRILPERLPFLLKLL